MIILLALLHSSVALADLSKLNCVISGTLQRDNNSYLDFHDPAVEVSMNGSTMTQSGWEILFTLYNGQALLGARNRTYMKALILENYLDLKGSVPPRLGAFDPRMATSTYLECSPVTR